MRHEYSRCLFLPLAVLLAALSFLKPARATMIDPTTWEQPVAGASCVGIVECETAGGIVADYRVVESWKGAPKDDRFRLRVAVNYWEPQFPITLVGDRYLVT